jgi:hypothetical protein
MNSKYFNDQNPSLISNLSIIKSCLKWNIWVWVLFVIICLHLLFYVIMWQIDNHVNKYVNLSTPSSSTNLSESDKGLDKYIQKFAKEHNESIKTVSHRFRKTLLMQFIVTTVIYIGFFALCVHYSNKCLPVWHLVLLAILISAVFNMIIFKEDMKYF